MLNLSFLKSNTARWLIAGLSILLYAIFAYEIERTDYLLLLTIYSGLFICFYTLVHQHKENYKFLVGIAFLCRAVFILSIPNLSQDFYRFLWDGRMLLAGFNPYLYTPESFISSGVYPITQAQLLYEGMQSLNASHYTNYPPVNQFCFALAALFTSKSIWGSALVLRLLIIAADFGIYYYGKKLLQKLKLPAYHIFWYLLNPFIIIELTGNLHFEGLMIFFLIWSIYLLYLGRWHWAAVLLGLSISTKLIPLLFLPLFIQCFIKKNQVLSGFKRLFLFYGLLGLTCLLLFAPFFSFTFIENYASSVGLWFGTFEFNASIYYLLREVGYWITGWNEIAIIAKILPGLVLLFVLSFSFFRKIGTTKELITAMLLAFSVYLFMSTTVHPWYIATLLILSVFTNYKFPLVWSFIGILSYLAYANASHSENLWVISLEYLVIYTVFLWELFLKHKKKKANLAYAIQKELD